METARLDFAASDVQAGFRLHRFEVFNWGTFHRHVWRIEPLGENALLTGDIGSGKSTLVDALTTLLVPSQRITYNQAAGAERRERSLLSYVKGYFKNERDETRFAARAVALREDNTYSVLLGYFHNAGFNQGITLAQVYWSQGDGAQPERFFLVADRPLSIAREFSGFGKEIGALKKRLRKETGVLLFDSFAQYAQEFRARMDIKNDQALELFYQTVSMKSVGNLTQFVRTHMLEEPGVEERLEGIKRDFDNLNRAHEAVKKAREQIGMLEPLVGACDECEKLDQAMAEMERCRGALHAYFSGKKSALLEERLGRLKVEEGKLRDRLERDRAALARHRAQRGEIQRSISENGGGRLESLSQEMERLETERHRRAAREKDYSQWCGRLGLEAAGDLDGFHAGKERVEAARVDAEAGKKAAESKRVRLEVGIQRREEETASLERELESLKTRVSNIPLESLEIRRRLCEAISMDENGLPFAGELLQVKSSQAEWEGAIERVARSFGMSLLVPEEAYDRVARYVDANHLGGRLVYFRVREEQIRAQEAPGGQRLLFQKMEVKPDSAFRPWLERELARRFDYVCCASLEEFQREPKALTLRGQVKSQGRRYEKDDRYRLDDKSRYVLGWSNAAKVQALQEQWKGLSLARASDLVALQTLEAEIQAIEQRRDAVRDLGQIREFQEIDWKTVASQIESLRGEMAEITQGSDVLRVLQASLVDAEARIAEVERALEGEQAEMGKLQERLSQSQALRQDALSTLAHLADGDREALFPRLEEMEAEALGPKKFTVESCDNAQTEMREWLQARLDAEAKRRARVQENIIKRMQEYKAAYPLDTREVDTSVEASGEFRLMLRRLREEDLPRHEQRFKALLNEGTINDIALFQSQLERAQDDIKEKIGRINASLSGIDYDPGTFIELKLEKTQDAEVKDFQRSLRACLGGALSEEGGDLYSEHKFLLVKEIIDRFKGREGSSDLDQKWTRKVTDVRNWFEFLVNEMWRETREVKEVYSDSSGKSGGQKEKLAYTILASALAYQFGLAWGEVRSRSFRFVMIDEAFGRGSDESARYALELFKKLNLQLLIVTPLQKIHVIEDYVKTVHFTYNGGGNESQMRGLSIEAYREERARRQNPGVVP